MQKHNGPLRLLVAGPAPALGTPRAWEENQIRNVQKRMKIGAVSAWGGTRSIEERGALNGGSADLSGASGETNGKSVWPLVRDGEGARGVAGADDCFSMQHAQRVQQAPSLATTRGTDARTVGCSNTKMLSTRPRPRAILTIMLLNPAM